MTPDQRRTARLWLRHVSACGVRFDVPAKLADALYATTEHRARTFVVPTKLDTLDRACVARLAETFDGRPVRLTLSTCRVGEAGADVRIVCSAPGVGRLGRIQRKHTAWLLPLVERGAAVYATAVTGGTPERPSLGVNVVIAGLDRALTPAPRTVRRPEPVEGRLPARHLAEPRARYLTAA